MWHSFWVLTVPVGRKNMWSGFSPLAHKSFTLVKTTAGLLLTVIVCGRLEVREGSSNSQTGRRFWVGKVRSSPSSHPSPHTTVGPQHQLICNSKAIPSKIRFIDKHHCIIQIKPLIYQRVCHRDLCCATLFCWRNAVNTINVLQPLLLSLRRNLNWKMLQWWMKMHHWCVDLSADW